jgi:hypothetical protein
MNNPPNDLIKAVYDAQAAEEHALNALSIWLGTNFSNNLAYTFQQRVETLRGNYRSALYDVVNLAREVENIKSYYKRLGSLNE